MATLAIYISCVPTYTTALLWCLLVPFPDLVHIASNTGSNPRRGCLGSGNETKHIVLTYFTWKALGVMHNVRHLTLVLDREQSTCRSSHKFYTIYSLMSTTVQYVQFDCVQRRSSLCCWYPRAMPRIPPAMAPSTDPPVPSYISLAPFAAPFADATSPSTV